VPEDVLSNIKVEPDDSELERQLALKKARKLKLQEAVTESKNSIEKVYNLILLVFTAVNMVIVSGL
jgi:hypothetical protein